MKRTLITTVILAVITLTSNAQLNQVTTNLTNNISLGDYGSTIRYVAYGEAGNVKVMEFDGTLNTIGTTNTVGSGIQSNDIIYTYSSRFMVSSSNQGLILGVKPPIRDIRGGCFFHRVLAILVI